MGYFSNGSEGLDYQSTWCDRCTHDDPDNQRFCPIWGLHLEWNPHEAGDRRDACDKFIPRIGIWNGACEMFVSTDAEWVGREDELRSIWNDRLKDK